ncbi:MAG: peptide chain release factor N(5)-glutamine methyltransferase [Akkermansiaceae bacterium]
MSTTVLDIIEKGTAYLEKKGIDDARRNMQLLVTHEIGCSLVGLYMQFDRPMTESELTPLRDKLKRRGEGEPLQHLLGTVEFYKREFKTDSRALIPRPETEELVSIILNLPSVKNSPPPAIEPVTALENNGIAESGLELESTPKPSSQIRILDMGTGSGVIGISLAGELGGRCQELFLADISADALQLARENAELLGTPRVHFCKTSLFSELAAEKFHLIVANLPYIAETDRDTLSAEVLRDPDSALFGGEDGLDIVREFIQQAPSYLHPGGTIALEIGYDQAEAVELMLNKEGFTDVHTHKDLNQIARFPIAIMP